MLNEEENYCIALIFLMGWMFVPVSWKAKHAGYQLDRNLLPDLLTSVKSATLSATIAEPLISWSYTESRKQKLDFRFKN